MARLIDKGTREYTCALIMMFLVVWQHLGQSIVCNQLYLFWHKILT